MRVGHRKSPTVDQTHLALFRTSTKTRTERKPFKLESKVKSSRMLIIGLSEVLAHWCSLCSSQLALEPTLPVIKRKGNLRLGRYSEEGERKAKTGEIQ